MKEVYYIFSGRFQPFHIGHASVIDYLIKKYNKKIIIGIINPDPRQPFPGDKKDWIRFRKDANPLTYWERHFLISRCIRELHFSEHVEAVVPLPRPSINISRANNYLPQGPRIFVLCQKWNDEVEWWKAQKYKDNMEEILFVPFENLNPLAQLASGELIRSLMKVNNSGWKFLLSSSVSSFIEKNGLIAKMTSNLSSEKANDFISKTLQIEKYGELLLELFEEYLPLGDKTDDFVNDTSVKDHGLTYFQVLGELIEKEPTNSIIIKELYMGNIYKTSQVIGSMGENARTESVNVQQVINQLGCDFNFEHLADELETLRLALKERSTTLEHDAEIGAIVEAQKAARKTDGTKVLEYLKKAGKWSFDAATDIGTSLVAEVLKKTLNL